MDDQAPLLGGDGVAKRQESYWYNELAIQVAGILAGANILAPFVFGNNHTLSHGFMWFPKPKNGIAAQNWVYLFSRLALGVLGPILINSNRKWAKKYTEMAEQKDVLERVRLMLKAYQKNPQQTVIEMKDIFKDEQMQSLKTFIADYVTNEYEQSSTSDFVKNFLTGLFYGSGMGIAAYIPFLALSVTAVDLSLLSNVGADFMSYGLIAIVAGVSVLLVKNGYDEARNTSEKMQKARVEIQGMFDGIDLQGLNLEGQIVDDLSDLLDSLGDLKNSYPNDNTMQLVVK